MGVLRVPSRKRLIAGLDEVVVGCSNIKVMKVMKRDFGHYWDMHKLNYTM